MSSRALRHPAFWIVNALAILDLAVTINGISQGYGMEANPFYKFFTERGFLWMILGALIHSAAVWVLFEFYTDWILSFSVGVLVAGHTYGFLSWVALYVAPEFGMLFFSNIFWMIMGPTILASLSTIWVYGYERRLRRLGRDRFIG